MFAKQLGKEFQLKILGHIKHYLCVDIQRMHDGSFILSQKQKIIKLLKAYNMEQSKSVQTLMVIDFQKTMGDVSFQDPDLYHSAVGSLLYLAQWRRPDIANFVGILSRLVSKPTIYAW